MVHIIGIAGKKTSGKTTFVDLYTKTHTTQQVYTHAFADPLKEACKILFLLSDEQLTNTIQKESIDKRWNLTPLQMMQWIGTDIMRKTFKCDSFPNQCFWIYHWLLWFKSYEWNADDIIFIPDVRFQNEVDFIHNTLHGIVVLIKREQYCESDNHESESVQLNNIDTEINNTDLNNFESIASNFKL